MDVGYDLSDGIARIRLERPERLNAVTPRLVDELNAALGRALREAQVVVLTGSGTAFCAGWDLKEPPLRETVLETRVRLQQLQEVTRRIRSFPGIVLAAVHGYALGAGCEFALACDLVVAAEGARFGFPEVGVGLSVTGGVSHLLPATVGPARAKELLVLGERITAARAEQLGLVNRVVPDGTHEESALELARTIAAKPPLAVSLAKRVIDLGMAGTEENAMATEVDHAIMTSLSGEGSAPRDAFVGG